MYWKSVQSKGIVYSTDAIISLIIVIGLTSSLVLVKETSDQNLNDVFLYQQAQDILEVCSIKNDLTDNCFRFITEINPAISYCLDNCTGADVLLNRSYVSFGVTLA